MDMHSFEIPLGTVTVTEPFELTQYFEYAAYYTVHRVLPGTYPVRVESLYPEVRGNRPFPYYLVVDYPTTIVGMDSYRDSVLGTVTTRTERKYAYQCAPELSDEAADEVDMLGGRFRPEPGRLFAACIAVNDPHRRYGTEPVVTRADLPAGFDDTHLPSA